MTTFDLLCYVHVKCELEEKFQISLFSRRICVKLFYALENLLAFSLITGIPWYMCIFKKSYNFGRILTKFHNRGTLMKPNFFGSFFCQGNGEKDLKKGKFSKNRGFSLISGSSPAALRQINGKSGILTSFVTFKHHF